jgi:hypothetical protein
MILDGRSYEVNDLLGQENREQELEELPKIREKANENIKKAFEKYANTYNLRTRVRNFIPGERIWLKNYCLSDAAKGFSAKLAPRYIQGKIIRKNGNVYEIENEKGKFVGKYHAKDLMPDAT